MTKLALGCNYSDDYLTTGKLWDIQSSDLWGKETFVCQIMVGQILYMLTETKCSKQLKHQDTTVPELLHT